jgi:hypothetical protein
VNHLDGQIFTPPYLLNSDGTAAARPNILASPADASPGDTLSITTDVPIAAASIIRRGCAAQHAIRSTMPWSASGSAVGCICVLTG